MGNLFGTLGNWKKIKGKSKIKKGDRKNNVTILKNG